MTLRGVEEPNVSLDSMVDKRLRDNIEQLMEIFPRLSISEIKNALAMFNGNFDDALDLLSGSPGPSSSQSTGAASSSQNNATAKVKNEYETLEDIENLKTREKVANLIALGISQPISFVLDILGNCNWNVDEAAIILLNYCIPMDVDGEIEGNREFVTEGTRQVTGDGASVASTTFDLTPPPTPPSPKAQQRYPGGVMPSVVLCLRNRDENPPNQRESQESQPPPVKDENDEQNQELMPIPASITVACNHAEVNKLGDKQNPEIITNSRHSLNNSTEMNTLGNERNLELIPSATYGFDSMAEMGLQENIDAKVAQLHEMLPKASKRRCKAILQIYPDIEEAFDVLFEEIAEHGPDDSSAETETEDGDSGDSNDESETEKGVRGRNPRAFVISLGSRRQEKRRAETPEEEPPAKKSRLLLAEENDEEAEAARLEPAGEWVLDTFSENGGISISLRSGKHPCKFPKGLLCRHFDFFKEQLNSGPLEAAGDPNEETIELPDIDREVFDLAIQLAITKSLQLHGSQSRTRSTEITALLELVILATRLGLPGAGYIVADRLKEILVDRRNALQGSHIETAYTLKKGHPIRKVIVQSLGRAFFILKQAPTSKKAQLYRKGEGDNARRSAFGRDRFMFQDQLDNINDFNLELSSQIIDILHDRNEIMSRSGKTRTITYTDPLSEEEFSL